MEPIKKLVKQASTQIDRERDAFAKQLGLTGVQMSVIDFLFNHYHEADQKAIEHEFDIRRSTTTIMLKRMEKRSLIKRVVDGQDKRKKKVRLTAKALALVPQIKEYMGRDDQKLRSLITKKEEETVEKVLRLIIRGENND